MTKKLVFKVLLVALLLATFTAWANTHDGAGSGGRAVDMGGGQFAIIPNAPIQPDSTSSSEALGECSCTNLKRLARARSSYYQILAPRCFQEYGGKAINATCQKTADGSNAPLPPPAQRRQAAD